MNLNESDLKALAKALRRELKQSVGAELSYNQTLELIARSLGHGSLAEWQATARRSTGATAPSAPAPEASAKEEPANQYRLYNMNGELDVTLEDPDYSDRTLVTGLGWKEIMGTSDSVLATAYVSHFWRDEEGNLEFDYSGQSEVEWNSQEQRTDGRGVALWVVHGADEVPADACILAPCGAYHSEGIDVRKLSVRKVLVDTVLRYLRDKDLVARAWEELQRVRAECFYLVQDPQADTALGQAERAVGFSLHSGEIAKLRNLLAEHVG